MKVNDLKELETLERRVKKEGDKLPFIRFVRLLELRRKKKAEEQK